MVNSHKEPRAVGDQCLSYTSESRAHHSPCQGSSPQHVAMLACVLELTHLLQTWAARNPSMQEALGRHISWFLVRRASRNTSHNTSIRRVSARLAMSPESDPPHPSHSRPPPGSRPQQAASYSKLRQSRVCEASNVSKYDGRPRTLRLRLGLG